MQYILVSYQTIDRKLKLKFMDKIEREHPALNIWLSNTKIIRIRTFRYI